MGHPQRGGVVVAPLFPEENLPPGIAHQRDWALLEVEVFPSIERRVTTLQVRWELDDCTGIHRDIFQIARRSAGRAPSPLHLLLEIGIDQLTQEELELVITAATMRLLQAP